MLSLAPTANVLAKLVELILQHTVVLAFTRVIKSVVTGQARVTLEWKGTPQGMKKKENAVQGLGLYLYHTVGDACRTLVSQKIYKVNVKS